MTKKDLLHYTLFVSTIFIPFVFANDEFIQDNLWSNRVEMLVKEPTGETSEDSKMLEFEIKLGKLSSSMVKKRLSQLIVDAVINEKFTEVNFVGLLNQISYGNIGMFEEVNFNAIDELRSRVHFAQLIEYANSHSYIEQEIYSYFALFHRLDYEFVFEVAHGFKRIMSYPNINKIDRGLKSQLESFSDSFPSSIKAAIFSNQVCIQSGSGGYLYAADDEFYIDDTKRTVLTRSSLAKNAGLEWKIEKGNEFNTFRIKNIKHGEYLLPSFMNVVTWTSGQFLTGCKLKLIPIEDDNIYIHIQALDTQRHLFSSQKPNGFVYMSAPLNGSLNSKWKLIEC